MNRKHLAPAALLVLLIASVATAQQEYDHEFTYRPDGNPSRVSVAGSFNGWSKDATPMRKGSDGTWRSRVKLTEGLYHYKFVVNGEQWIVDPKSDKSLDGDDNYGGKNSGVVIGPDIRKAPLPKPNDIAADWIVFRPADLADANRVDDRRLSLRVRALAGDVEQVAAVGLSGADKIVPLPKVATINGHDVFAALLDLSSWARPDAGFALLFQDGSAVGRLAPQGFVNGTEGPVARGFDVPSLSFTTPDWAKHAVWYQIFPERFRNGDPANDPNDHDYERVVPWTGDWWKTQPGEAPGDENFYQGQGNVWKRRYGGDIQGLRESLPYLKKLGINAIYLNPIFEADSMHKYDASDYRHVDDNFGFKGDIQQLTGETDDPATWKWTKTDKLFLDFVAEAHRQGFKVIIDGVFNHVGRSHPFFQDVLKNGKRSRYADWFEVTDWNSNPIQYKAWDKENGELPVFRKDAARGLASGPRDHIFAITKRWLAPDGDPSRGVDGWRLDVPGDIPHPFWIEWRKIVKSAKPDAYISGEIWTWAQPWLKGDQFDAVMNYRFADAAQKFFVNQNSAITPGAFGQALSEIAYAYPFQVALVQQNLFDSHDTDRLASMFVNPDLPYDARNRLQDNGPEYKKDKPTPEHTRRMLQAIATQMSYVGAPMLYYGTEAGMWSPDDPSNRMPMVWPEMTFADPQVKFDPQVFASVQRAIAVRAALPALRLGFFRGVLHEDDRGIYTFARDFDGHSVYVVVNRSSQQRRVDVPVDAKAGDKFVDWLDPASTQVTQSADERPKVELKSDARVSAVADGLLSVTLTPFTTAVLSKQ